MKSDPDHGTSETLGVAPARPEHLNRIRSELTADLRHRPATAQRHQNRHPSWPRRAGRLLSILAFSALCILPDRASADQLKPHESLASEISSLNGARAHGVARPALFITGTIGVSERRT